VDKSNTFFCCTTAHLGPRPPRLFDASRLHAFRHTKLNRTSLNEWSSRRRDRSLQNSDTRDEQPYCQRDSNSRSPQSTASDLRIRLHGHRDRRVSLLQGYISCNLL